MSAVAVDRPLFSVVIPTYRRPRALRTVLEAYQRQQPADLPFELVVVDDGSGDAGENGGDPTRALLASWRPCRYGWRVASQANAGPAAARNRALAMARGELVLFTGDDIEPSPTLLAEHGRAHRALDDPRAVVLGRTAWPPGVATTATMRHVDGVGAQQFSYHFMTDGAEYDFRHFYTSNVSIRRDLLDREPSYFSTDFPAAAFEDAELAYRLAGHGARIVYRAAALAFHHHRYGVASFFRRQVRCGAMADVLYRKRPELARFLGVRELSWLRLDALAARSVERVASARLAAELERWEARLLSFAAFFDPLGGRAPVDDLLLNTFAYGYRKGLAESRYGPASHPVLAHLFRATIPAAVAHAARLAQRAGLPLPTADHRAFAKMPGTF